MAVVVEKLRKALETIKCYTAKKKPATLAEAKHMLDVIEVIAKETLIEAKAETAK